MEKCFYKYEEIFAVDIYKDFTYESQIRAAGRNGELQCGDENCRAKVVYNYAGNKKNHVAKKVPYFSHYKPTNKCQYSDYFTNVKKRNEKMRTAINNCYLVFKEKHPNNLIKREEKLVPNHWTDISIHNQHEIIAIEFINGYKTPKYMTEMLALYSAAKIRTIIIFVDKVYNEEFEYDFNYAKRTQLNNDNGILTYLDNGKIKLIKNDPAQYENFNEHSLFVFDTDLSSIDLVNEQFYHPDFKRGFEQFISNRKEKYQKLLSQRPKTGFNSDASKQTYLKNSTSIFNEEIFYETNKTQYPLSIETIKTEFNKYLANKHGTERKHVSYLFHSGYKYDPETKANLIQFYKDIEKNETKLFIKFNNQFGSLIKPDIGRWL